MAPLQLLAPILLLASAAQAVSGLYLPLTNLTVAVPRDVEPPVSLLNFNALDADDGVVQFRLLGNVHWLQVDSESGELAIVAKILSTDLPRTVTVLADVSDPYFGSVSSANATVRFVATNTTACEMSSQDMCFWREARYQILENQKETNLGPVGPPAFCQYRKPQYKLKPDSLVFLDVSEERSSVVSREDLDRDREHSPVLPVVCSVGNAQALYSFRVLDEDDNPPEPNDEFHAVFNSSGNLVMGQVLGFIMLKDLDSLDVNEYKWEILGDSLQLFRANCRATSIHHTIEDMTYLRCDILAANTTQLPMNRYSALLRINDTKMANDNMSSYIDVNVELQKPVATPSSAAHVDLSRLSVAYPSEVSILRGAAPLTRVAQPTVNMSTLMLPHAPRFSLVKNPYFNITAVGGIIYLAKDTKKPELGVLQFAPPLISITVQWNNSSSKITVIVVDGSSKACESRTGQWPRCSKYTNPKDCNQACGWGTGAKHASVNNFHEGGADNYTEEINEHGGCVWRGDRYGKSNGFTIKYATCVPSIDTCPDQLCDPLEEIKPELCPQDCYENAMGMMGSNNDQNRGMYSGHGVCRCEKKICFCSDVIATQNNKSPSSKTTTRHVEGTTQETPPASSPSVVINSRAECGQDCVMVVAAACLVVVSATLGFAYWRYRPAGKLRRDRKLVDHGGVGSLAAVQSDYVDRTTDTLTTSAEFRTPPDPKWEFPRSRLIIDRTLGEGEFGRVMRARAIDINGIPGSSTVAVKTLKEGASSAELADLLSEYQLLKEVNHPNVIRLLGACTTPGAPVYLIIEFAEYGSLRNFLRKSRHLEPSSAPTGPTKPRDILSFAWQICKGMTYLSEIKLVHRDLAARNVLVAAGGICKVSDFGLTRDVYEDDAYLKRSKGRVPVKWMALESLADHVYTSKSDVWSFGVLLWELVTLGASPYPGVAVHNLFHLLRAGYRMERPENCSPALYRVMRTCWMDDPTDRPSFKKLTETFEQMLQDGVEYLDLNPRVVQNKAYFSSLSRSGDNLDESDLGYGNINILPTDSVNYLLPTQRSTFIQNQQTWQVIMPEEKQQLLTDQDEKTQGTPLQSSAVNMYLSPIHVQNHSSTYMNMAGSSVPDLTVSQRNSNSQLCNERSTHSSPCTSLLTPL